MYYKSSNALVFSTKTKQVRNNKRNSTLSAAAQYWKSLALKKTGSTLSITARPFIGTHQNVNNIIKQDVDNAVKAMATQIGIQIKLNK